MRPRFMNSTSVTPLRVWSGILAIVLCVLSQPSRAAEPLTPCRVPGFRSEVQCGVLQRALDPERPQGPQIAVHYVVVPALARRKRPDPVFFLAGGPGQSAIRLAPTLLQQLGRLNNRRDLVFVDQRGTGQTAPLMCSEDSNATLAQSLDPQRRDALLRECLAQLQGLPYGDLRFFTTTLAMQDLDAVRQALGAQRINLIGASYGTRAVLEYLRQFPNAVRRSVMDGVAPPDMVLPVSVSSDNQAAFDAMFTACEQDSGCARAYPGLRVQWSSLLARLPVSATVAHPFTGRREQVSLTRESLLASVRTPLYSPVLASTLPQAISEAVQGRFEALVALGSAFSAHGPNRLAEGMHFSVVCAEDRPRFAAVSEAPGADFGASFAQIYSDACAYWPRGAVPAAFYAIPASATPVLLLSGALDPVTPPRHAARVAKALGSLARHLVVENSGHGVMMAGCVPDLLIRFIDASDDAAALALDSSCAKGIPRATFFYPVARAQGGLP